MKTESQCLCECKEAFNVPAPRLMHACRRLPLLPMYGNANVVCQVWVRSCLSYRIILIVGVGVVQVCTNHPDVACRKNRESGVGACSGLNFPPGICIRGGLNYKHSTEGHRCNRRTPSAPLWKEFHRDGHGHLQSSARHCMVTCLPARWLCVRITHQREYSCLI